MKRFLIFLLSILCVASTLNMVIYASGNDKSIYDSKNIEEHCFEYFTNRYNYLTEGRNVEEVSKSYGADVNEFIKREGFVRIYNNESLLEDFVNNKTLNEIIGNSKSDVYKALYSSDPSFKYLLINNFNTDTPPRSRSLYSYEYARFQNLVLDPTSLFSTANITKDINGIVVEKVYFFDNFSINLQPIEPKCIIYYVTNRGDYVYYVDGVVNDATVEVKNGALSSDYFFTADRFMELLKKAKDIAEYDGFRLDLERLSYLDEDLSHYTVSGEYVGERKEYYYAGTALGYKTYNDFKDALKAGGYDNIRAFREKMTEAGYTTYGEYRIALDKAIAENAIKAAESDIDPAPTDKNGGYLYLLWIIIPVAVIIVGLVIFIAVGRKKRAV